MQVIAGVGIAAPGQLTIPLPPHHPSAHGALDLALTLDGQRIVSAEPRPGALHRGIEKLFEVRDYRQALMLADRHDWVSAFSNELGIALAVESMLGLHVPERVTWLRTLFAEFTRVASHLAFLGAFPYRFDDHAETSRLHDLGHTARERVLRLLESAWGGRIHVMANRVGGLAADLPDGWIDELVATLPALREATTSFSAATTPGADALAGLEGTGVLSAADALSYGVSGPMARASGVDVDLRRDLPHLAYAELFRPGGPGRVCVETTGDIPARLRILTRQLNVSLDLIEACLPPLERIGPGEVSVRLPKVVRLPEGQIYAATEGPSGTNGYFLISSGGTTPWRLKLRSAAFNNVAALAAVLPGTTISDLDAALASLFFVTGDLDK